MPRYPLALLVVSVLCLVLIAAACMPAREGGDAGDAEVPADIPDVPAAGLSARAVLEPLGDSGVGGWVSFTEVEGGIQVEANVTGLTPGEHGFHIHQWGDCSAPDGTSAGGHFNPQDVPHAGPDADQAHAGDLGNVLANDEGLAEMARLSARIVLDAGAANGILGRGVIVHAKADDLTSQPTGAAGGRLACGVILLEGGESAPVLASGE